MTKMHGTNACPACRGFSMLEIVVVLAIVAILALLAMPNFSDKIIRDQIVEAMPLADIAKPPVAAAWALGAPLPVDNIAAGLPAADKIVSNLVGSVALNNGAIDITFGNSAHPQIKSKVLSLRPAVVADTPLVPITWVCGNAAAPDKMTLQGSNSTNIPANYLPFKCRSITPSK
jgi:type IV pilus assembly protein PilA